MRSFIILAANVMETEMSGDEWESPHMEEVGVAVKQTQDPGDPLWNRK